MLDVALPFVAPNPPRASAVRIQGLLVWAIYCILDKVADLSNTTTAAVVDL
jgi:hypothetical protein